MEKLYHGALLSKSDMNILNIENEFEKCFGESILDTEMRFLKWFRLEYLTWKDSEFIILVSHANLIRAMLRYFENYSDEEIENVSIPTAKPIKLKIEGVDLIKKELIEHNQYENLSFNNEQVQSFF